SLAMTIFLPIMVTLVFVYVFGGALGPGGDRIEYLKFVLPGIIIMAPAFGAYMTAVGVNNDMSKGIIDRFRTMDINQSSVLTGHIFASVIRNILGAIIIISFSYLIGFRADISLIDGLMIAGMVLIYILMITMVSLMVGLVGNSAESVGGIMMFIQFAPYVSSAFIPTETMPKALRYFADYQPFTPIVNTTRGLFFGTDIGLDWLIALAWCLGIVIVCFIISKYAYLHKTSQ
ncbi:MAG: ABC transporter permease, partial [Clostridia bacterium]|nr:ABC transporter permease [Clostridia bacterium]